MGKYTERPWESSKTEDSEYIEVYHDSILIADVLNCGPVDGPANAALITAAPDMLKMLERMYAKMIRGGSIGSYEYMASVGDTIAKAKGE